MHVTIGPCDPLNHGFGYQIRIEQHGVTLLFTSRHPVTGADLTYETAVEVAAMYGAPPAQAAIAAAVRELEAWTSEREAFRAADRSFDAGEFSDALVDDEADAREVEEKVEALALVHGVSAEAIWSATGSQCDEPGA